MSEQNLIRESDNSRIPAQRVSILPQGINITAAMMVNERVNIPSNTTINEDLEIEVQNSLGTKNGRDFILGYFGVGIKGSQVVGKHPITQTEIFHTNQHQPFDQNMFFGIPLLTRPLNDDLPEQERDNFRLRKVVDMPDGPRVFYWLRKIDKTLFDPKTMRVVRSEETGNEKPLPYVYRPESLNPTPVKLNTDGSVPLSNSYLTNSGLLDLSLNGTALEELRNVCRVLYNDASLAAISEYMVCYGIETTTEGRGENNSAFRHKELISTTAAYLVTERHRRDANANGEIKLHFDLASAFPLLLDE